VESLTSEDKRLEKWLQLLVLVSPWHVVVCCMPRPHTCRHTHHSGSCPSCAAPVSNRCMYTEILHLQMSLDGKSSVRRAVDEAIRLYSPSINIRYWLAACPACDCMIILMPM
jgi:hypothetical protein